MPNIILYTSNASARVPILNRNPPTEVRELYFTIRDGILTSAEKLSRVSLTYRKEPTTFMWKTEKLDEMCRKIRPEL